MPDTRDSDSPHLLVIGECVADIVRLPGAPVPWKKANPPVSFDKRNSEL